MRLDTSISRQCSSGADPGARTGAEGLRWAKAMGGSKGYIAMENHGKTKGKP